MFDVVPFTIPMTKIFAILTRLIRILYRMLSQQVLVQEQEVSD